MVLVILGPTAELHTGIHGGLTDRPPPGVTYLHPPHTHRFAFESRQAPDPFRAPSLLEAVDYGLPSVLRGAVAGVHSARLPALGIPWLADTDDLVLTLAYGRPLARGARRLPDLDSEAVRRRALMMCALYAAPSCVGVLLRTERARRDAVGFLEDLPTLGPELRERVLGKLDVVRPAVAPVSRPERSGPQVSVTYMGRSYADKGGPVAAAVFRALAGRHEDLALTWVGPCPAVVRRSLPRVQFHEVMSRTQFLDVLATTDIFFSPTRYESFGAALAEAAAGGCVLLSTRGSGMTHLGEIYEDGVHGRFVDGDQPATSQASDFVSAVEELLASPPTTRRMQEANRTLGATGALSLSRRDAALAAAYDRLARTTHQASAAAPAVLARSWRDLSDTDMARRYAAHGGRPRRRVVVGNAGPS